MIGFNLKDCEHDAVTDKKRIFLNPENCTFVLQGDETLCILPCGLVYTLDHEYSYILKTIREHIEDNRQRGHTTWIRKP